MLYLQLPHVELFACCVTLLLPMARLSHDLAFQLFYTETREVKLLIIEVTWKNKRR